MSGHLEGRQERLGRVPFQVMGVRDVEDNYLDVRNKENLTKAQNLAIAKIRPNTGTRT